MKEVSIRCEGARSVSINDLHPFQDDIKTMKPSALKKLERVIMEQGFSEPIAVWSDSPDGKLWILNGHQRMTALQSLASKGWFIPPIPVALVSAEDEQEARKKVLTLASQFGDFSGDHLAEFVAKAQLDTDWIRNNARLAAGDFKLPVMVTPTDEDEVPPPPDVEIVKRGEVYLLDRHRLMCGDSTSIDDVEKLMAGRKAGFIFTDPPYGVGFKYNAHDDSGGEKYADFMREIWHILLSMNCPIVLTPGNNNLPLWLGFADFKMACWVKKNAMSPSSVAHLNVFEVLLAYGVKARRNTDLFEYSVKQQKDVGDHPCPKLFELVEDAVNSWAPEKCLLFEPFGGSGTTMIVAEKTNRQCFMMELDPKYCAVIIDRWQSMSGKNAIRESDGRLWDDIKAEALST